MLETVLPLNLFRRLGIDSGNGYGSEGDFCRKIRLGLSGLLYSRLLLIAVTHVLGK